MFDWTFHPQGPPLADNIARLAQGMPLRPWIPQSTNLNLISAGDKYAIGVKGWFGWQGAFLWTWKDWIDRKFMAKYGDDLDFNMDMNAPPTAGGEMGAVASPEAVALAAAAKMRCGGCGSKVGATTLERVLQQLRSDAAAHTAPPLTPAPPENVLVGIDIADDAAVLAAPPQGHVTVHTVDFFRAPAALNDPYTFGQVAANHALSDCYAMGAAPAAALAIVVLPFAAESKVESDLYQLMAGAVEVLARAGCSLVGGHTCEGAELALGFSIYGTAMPEQLMQRGGMAPGQALVLTKALGTGVLMAAAMRGQPVGRHLQAAIDGMILSNKGAAEVLKAYGATACADVTGFGLLGHLAEMARASKVAAVVSAGTVPLLPGASTCARSGVLSSMHVENAKVAAVLDEAGQWVGHEVWPLLVDPQTSGGLLASVPAGTAEECVRALQEAGYADAAVIGEVVEADSGSLIKLK